MRISGNRYRLTDSKETMESDPSKDEIGADESEKNEIRRELSKMSFEDLKRLKEKLGSKVYKEAVFGKKSIPKSQFKRENKNRPREVSSKVKPICQTKKKVEKRIADPRFNRLCGEFNRKHFENTYGFLSDLRENEKHQLEEMLKRETNPNEVEKIKYLLQRMKNQELERQKANKRQERREQEINEQIRALESGQKPHFKTKYEQKIVDLVDKYSTLKKTGKVQKFIEKKQKKLAFKEKKRKRYFHQSFD